MNEYYKHCKFAKPTIKKHKRETVKDETYKKVWEVCKGKCVICGATDIQAHHIRYRSERKDLINEPTNIVMLCVKHHAEIHKDKRNWQPVLLKIAKEIYK